MTSWDEAGRGKRRGRLRAALGLLAAAGVALAAEGQGRADPEPVTWMPGNSREIARTASASRDASVSGLVFAPRVAAKGAADLAFAKIEAGGIALRPGMFAFFELEHADEGLSGPLPLPGEGKGPMLWRGMFGFSLMLSAERLAHAWLGPRGAIEWGATLGHESDHVTGADFDDAPDPGDIPDGGGGNFILYELAMRSPVDGPERVDGWWRVEDRAYFAGPILHAPGVEAGVRWHLTRHLEPVASIFAETLLVDREHGVRNGGVLGVLAGVAAPGAAGELLPYVAVDAGNGKGLLINRREVVTSIGVRYAPF